MQELDSEARAFLEELQDQPERVRQVFIYAICQTMQQAGHLESVGAFDNAGIGVTLIYRNPETGEVFEIVKPDITTEEENALNGDIAELLAQNARTAA
jgi:hypothetical protein